LTRAGDITVRRLGPDDAARYQALRLRGLEEHPESFTSSAQEEAARPLQWAQDRLRGVAERPHDLFLGAFRAGMLLGIVGLQGRYRPKERHNATVVGMYVVPEVSGQGVGRSLMQALLQEAALIPGLEQLDLTVTEGNDAARTLYARCGFVEWGRLPRAVRIVPALPLSPQGKILKKELHRLYVESGGQQPSKVA